MTVVTASPGSRGVVSVFATQIRPPGLRATASPSVNVPPMSTAMRSALPLSFFFGTNHQSRITNHESRLRYFNAAHARRMRWQASDSSSMGDAMDMRK